MQGKIKVICIKCGESISKDIKGSLKQPYCKKCFKKEFKDYNEYHNFLLNRELKK